MSKHQAIKAIRQEIDRLNREIDLKIIQGVSYAREARRHKFLMSQLSRLTPRPSWFAKSVHFMSAFMF